MLKPKGLTKDHKPRMDFPRKMNSYKNFIDSSSPDTNEKKQRLKMASSPRMQLTRSY